MNSFFEEKRFFVLVDFCWKKSKCPLLPAPLSPLEEEPTPDRSGVPEFSQARCEVERSATEQCNRG